MTAGRTPEWRDVSELRDSVIDGSAIDQFLDRLPRLPRRAARVLTEQEGGAPNERWEQAGDDEPRLDHFLAKLDRMVNDDAIGDYPREVRATLDEAQATIRRLRAGGGVTAGQDEEPHVITTEWSQTTSKFWSRCSCGQWMAHNEKALVDSWATAHKAAVTPAPAVDTAAADPLRALVEALLAALAGGQQHVIDHFAAEVRRHLDGPARDEPQDGGQRR